jgi:uncharacterized protein (DUF2126 family)
MSVTRPSEQANAYASSLQPLAQQVSDRLHEHGVRLTLGGEPTLVPEKPEGSEWNFVAVGPTKLGYAYALAGAIIERFLPDAVTIFSPGKTYPGEINPRWVVNILANRDGTPVRPPAPATPVRARASRPALAALQKALAAALQLPADAWHAAEDPRQTGSRVAILPLDHDGKEWRTEKWELPTAGRGRKVRLLAAEGPAGLRLPLNELAPEAMRRALTLEWREDEALHLFLPPLLQPAFCSLLDIATSRMAELGITKYFFEGYLPQDEANRWTRVGLTADPGVLEINIPPCEAWLDYHRWLMILEETGRRCGLRSWKENAQGDATGTGGGNHLLFGGPSVEENPFFARPAWVASLLRFFQAHPSLAYLFTGVYVGASSQAPRPDESARDLFDLDLAYEHLASLPPGDHRWVIGETLRHMHTDITGNTHRSEISFDKFWNVGGPFGATAGLIEFRAIESLPQAHWMSLVALLWQAIAAHTLSQSSPRTLIDHGSSLHDRFFLPTPLWDDLRAVLDELARGGFEFPIEGFRSIWRWRFPLMLTADLGDGMALEVRRACESWPLLCETPSEGGTTSRFVDTSIERLELVAPAAATATHRFFVNGRELSLMPLDPLDTAASADGRLLGCGLRYRRTALYPSLHPGIAPHLPLEIAITSQREAANASTFRLAGETRQFVRVATGEQMYAPGSGKPAMKSNPALLAYDLRLD